MPCPARSRVSTPPGTRLSRAARAALLRLPAVLLPLLVATGLAVAGPEVPTVLIVTSGAGSSATPPASCPAPPACVSREGVQAPAMTYGPPR